MINVPSLRINMPSVAIKTCCFIVLLAAFGVSGVVAQDQSEPIASNPGGFQSLLAHNSSVEALQEPVSVHFDGVTLADALAEIAGKSGLELSYSPDTVPLDRLISLQIEEASVAEALEAVVANTSLKVLVTEGGEIVIVEGVGETKGSSLVAISQRAAASPLQISELKQLVPTMQHEVYGQVTEVQTGEPIPGVNVIEQGTTTGTTTDADGNYEFTISSDESVLVFSFVGYDRQEVAVEGRSQIDVAMAESVGMLDDLIVVGYGEQRREDLTGSVSSVRDGDFTEGVNSSALQLLQGRAAGVYISQSSSAPGGELNVMIRGAGSINSSNNALVVIDGMPGASTSALSPGDIESIEILKDASASAIYGTRGANGVILITTKRGQSGAPRVNYEGYVGSQEVANTIDLLNASEYMNVLNNLSIAEGRDPIYTQEEISQTDDGTDWQNQLFRSAIAHNHQLSLSGGTDFSTYYVGLNYLDQEGVVLGSGQRRYNARLNQEITPLDQLTINLNLNTHRRTESSILTSNSANENAGPINAALQFDPTIPPTTNEDGRYELNPTIALDNPLALLHGYDQERVVSRTYGTLSAEFEILRGLTTTLRLGADYQEGRVDGYRSRLTQTGLGTGGNANVQSYENSNWLIESLLEYQGILGDAHRVRILGGATFEKFDSRNLNASAQGFLSDVTGTNLLQSGDSESVNVGSGRSTNQLNGYLARLNYNFLERYSLTSSVRIDGSSRFSSENQYAVFPSLSAAWNISEEPFFANQQTINDLRLRVGYGQIGNQGISNFETIQTFVAGGSAVFGNSIYQGVNPARIPNADIKWETTEEYNVGVEIGLFDNRLSGAFDYFVKDTHDQLFQLPLPLTSGFSNVRTNAGHVRNSGTEVFVESQNLTGGLEWTTSFNFAWLNNEVVELPDFIPELITGNIGTFTNNFLLVREGAPMWSFYGYEVEGIFQEGDDIASSAQPTANPGHPIFADQNGDGVINAEDRTILGNPFPDYTFGFQNSFRYQGFNLDVFFVGVQGIQTLDNNVLESLFPINFARNRIAKYYLDRWTPDNPSARYPSGVDPSSYGSGRQVNSLTVTDASFIRLRTVTLSYDLPLREDWSLQSAQIAMSADNLFTWTDYDGYDPDANAYGSSASRVAYNSYPLNRTYRLSVTLGF